MSQSIFLRGVLNTILIIAVFFLPWWVIFIGVVFGAIMFPWYLEALFFGLYFDVFFGYPALSWYVAITHTALFMMAVLVAEFIKPRINV